MSADNLTYKPFGKHAILIEWPAIIDENTLKNVLKFKNSILKNNIKVIVDIINTYNSITVFYNTTIDNIDSEFFALKSIYTAQNSSEKIKNNLWKIPVCYDAKYGIDLEEISTINKLTTNEIIDFHSVSIYTVYFIGFLPGFLYLGGLDEKLHFPRKPNPRLEVERGSVGVGGSQTGIYPQNSAGGWNIIGKSPISFFDVRKAGPCFAKSGDKIQFFSIGLEEFQQIKTQVNIGFYELEKEPLND